MYKLYEEKFNVIYPESSNATYVSLMNYSDEMDKPFQRWYRYKEGYSTELVQAIIKEYNTNPEGIILDPFMGSGTTLLAASKLGLKSIGFEVNPFSYFLSRLKLKNYTQEFIEEFRKSYLRLLKISIDNNDEFELPLLSTSKNVFDENIRHFYMGFKNLIKSDLSISDDIKDLLMLGWLSCLEYISNYKKSGNGLKKRKYVNPRIITIDDICNILNNQYSNMYEDMKNNNIVYNVDLYNDTCLNMKNIKDKAISGIIFSPPYANCFDYTEIYKLELWFGDFVKEYSDLKKLRLKSLRSHLNGVDLNTENVELKTIDFLENLIPMIEEKELWSKKIPSMLRCYFHDMFTLLEDCYRVLEDDGFCSIIVSNSAYGGIIVPTDLILADYAEKIGFEVDKIEVDRYIITSSQQYEATKENKQFLRESLICLKKSSMKEENKTPIIVDTLPMDIDNNAVYLINQSNTNDYTHNYFKYPCKFIPEIPRWAIKKYANEGTIIFDPFSGSGTTLVESIVNGYDAYGTEIDDVAKLLIKVKTTRLTNEEIEEMNNIVDEILSEIDENNENAIIPHINNINHWFPTENIKQLGQIRFYINQINNQNIKDFLLICLASIIRKCSYADDSSPKPYVSSKVKKVPGDPKKEFNSIFKKYRVGMEKLLALNTENNAEIVNGNALKVNIDRTVDLIITSPPYINAFDYARTMRLENLWLGYLTESEITKKKQLYVGTENIKKVEEIGNLEILDESNLLKEYYNKILEVDEKRALIVKRFFQDMKINLEEMYRMLNPNGHYCIVIGNSTIRGIKVESWKVLRDLALKIGFEVDLEFSYIIKNPYLSIPRNGKGGKISSDYILVLKKTN